MDPNSSILKGLDAGALAHGRRPPVETWDPPFCGDIDMVIRRDGVWMYQGSPIGKARLVRLFSTVLKREGDQHFLVTPAEKIGIRVEDAPFLAVAMDVEGARPAQRLSFTTNVGDRTIAGADNPLRCVIDPETEEPAVYVHVRGGLEARINRAVYYDLVAFGVEEMIDGRAVFGVWSAGAFFPFIEAAALRDPD